MGSGMEWDEENRDRLYALVHAKLKKINDETPRNTNGYNSLESAERFYLVRRIYWELLDSLGILSTRWKKSRKVPPHWVVYPKNEKPADMENNVVIPDPFYSDKPTIKDNGEKELGLLVPKDTAWKILVLGMP